MKLACLTPKLNANDLDLEILKWHAQDGELVEAGSALVDLGTSKASFTCEAEHGGFLRCLKKKGESAAVGEPFAFLFTTLEEWAADKPEPAESRRSGPRLSAKARAHGHGEELGL